MKKIAVFLLLLIAFPVMSGAENLAVLDKAGLDELVSSNKGKVVMLNFFATWCPPCRLEIRGLVDMRKKYPEDKVAIIGLAVDEDITPVMPFVRKAGIDYPVFVVGKDVTGAFSISSVPHNAFYDKNGVLVVSAPGMVTTTVLGEVFDDLLAK